MESETLSPEIVSFLLALRGVRQIPRFKCFGRYRKKICGSGHGSLDYVCSVCEKMHIKPKIEWIDALLKAYPSEVSNDETTR